MYQYQINVWIEQTSALSALVKSHLQDVFVPYSDTATKISQTVYFNAADQNNLANIFWGFTQGTGDAVQQVPITNTVVFFPNTATTCNYLISTTPPTSPPSATYTSTGGPGSVALATAGNCYWAVSSLANWITITPPLYGLGNGTISYTIAANTGPARIGYINIAGQAFQVNQDSGLPTCTLTAGANIVPYNGTNSLTWSVSGGTATTATWTTSPGDTCGSPNPAGGSCTTAAQTTAGARTYILTVSNAFGSNSCSTTFYVGCQNYSPYNNTGSRTYFKTGTTCSRINSGSIITNALASGVTVTRYGTSDSTCSTALGSISYTAAMNADIFYNGGDADCTVYYNLNDTVTDR
jgi:hypothetical protein